MPRSRVRLLYVASLGLAAPLAVFAYLAAVVVRNGDVRWDDEAARLARRAVLAAPIPFDGARLLDSPAVTALFVLTAFGVALLLLRGPPHAAFWIAAVGSVFALDPLLKEVFRRPGPGSDYSFPSGSAIFSAVVVTAIVAVMPRGRVRVVVALSGGIICIAFGAPIVDFYRHYPSDVVAGWAFGLAWTTALWLAFFGRSRLAGESPRASGAEGESSRSSLAGNPPRLTAAESDPTRRGSSP